MITNKLDSAPAVFDVTEPVEITLTKRNGDKLILLGVRTEEGLVRCSLTNASGGTAQSLSNLQSKGTYPRKAVKGWQAELVEFARAGLYTITQVR